MMSYMRLGSEEATMDLFSFIHFPAGLSCCLSIDIFLSIKYSLNYLQKIIHDKIQYT